MSNKVEQRHRDAAWPYAKFHCLPDSQMRERWFSGYYDEQSEGKAIRDFAAFEASLARPQGGGELRGPFPLSSPFGETGRVGSPDAYLIDPGAGSGSDRVTRFWPSAQLDDIHARGGSITPLYASATPPADERGEALREALREQTAIVDRLLTAVDCAAEDIGHERVDVILRELGPANDKARAALATRESE